MTFFASFSVIMFKQVGWPLLPHCPQETILSGRFSLFELSEPIQNEQYISLVTSPGRLGADFAGVGLVLPLDDAVLVLTLAGAELEGVARGFAFDESGVELLIRGLFFIDISGS
jgi:hypothetical protein